MILALMLREKTRELGLVAKPAEPDFQAGDKVSFVTTRRSSGGIRFSSREGTVACVRHGLIRIKSRGRDYVVSPDVVRKIGQQNALTEAVLVGLEPEARHG